MGMDVRGKKPTSEVGRYFRNSVWWWHPLWEYCEVVAGDLTRKVQYGHSNDGDGLGASDSAALAKALKESIASGRCERYFLALTAVLDALPREQCKICCGTGKRDDDLGRECRRADPGYTCNGCDGKGTTEPHASLYRTEVDNVREFADFLADCGGFEIRSRSDDYQDGSDHAA